MLQVSKIINYLLREIFTHREQKNNLLGNEYIFVIFHSHKAAIHKKNVDVKSKQCGLVMLMYAMSTC